MSHKPLSAHACASGVRFSFGMGRPLFVRNKGGASLTPAGEQFLRFAPTFVQLWHRAKQQVAVPVGIAQF
jgi:hypothetical protein